MGYKVTKKEKDFGLVQKALCGDQKAFNEIFNKYNLTLNYQIASIIDDAQVVEDLVMETFEKAFQRLGGFQPDYQLGAWLIRIGRNCAIDYCRKKNRVLIVSIDEGFDSEEDERPTIEVIDNTKNPEENMAFSQRLEYVRSVLDYLPEIHKRVMVMRYFDDCSYEEIAEAFDVTVQQVKSLLHKAKKDLIKLVQAKAYKDIMNS